MTSGQCKTQTVDYCFHYANENVTTIVPLFSNPINSSPQSVCSLHFTLPLMTSLLRLECQQKDFFKTKFDLQFTVFLLFKWN